MKSLIVLSLCCLLAACGSRQQKKDEAREAFPLRTIVLGDSLMRDTVDLGTIHEGEIVRQDLLLRNGGRTAMVILSVGTSCGCTTVDFDRKPVPPGADASFAFEYNSRGFYGYQLKHITIRTTLSDKPYTLVVTGDVTK